ncbi:MAG: heme-binding protein [Pseudomonadota bacterium]
MPMPSFRLPAAAPTALLLAALLVLTASFAPVAMATEEPKFETVEREGAFELRLYAPMIVAETWVEGSLGEGSNAGFRRIAGYIFGRNRSRTAEGSEKIAMTVPVTMQPGAGQKIAMTSPVTTEAATDPRAPASGGSGGKWRMHFVMPAQYTMATLPVPEDPTVTLREVPAQRTAVRTFSGFVTEDRVREETALLLGWMKGRGLQPSAPPQLARYNPPWSIPFLRRNEILVSY